MNELAKDEFMSVLPPDMQKHVNKEVRDNVNKLLTDVDYAEQYRENLLSYTTVLTKGKFKLSGYIKAVKYVSLCLQGHSSNDAFSITFPEKIDKWDKDNVDSSTVSKYCLLYTSPSPRDATLSRMPSSA